MERTRESRRSSMVSSNNGFPRRRHRTIALRDSSEEGAVELREGSSKRGRNRDRDSANRSKRRRGSHSLRDDGEQSTEESVGNDQDDDVQDAMVSKIRSANTTSSASDQNQNHRRSFTPAKPPPFKVTEEMIGVTVPRKARSASVKRNHESWVSASSVGGGEDQNCRPPSNSPGSHSVEAVSPSSSNVSVRKKMKATEDVPKTSKSSSSDIEIEIAELLYGLKTSKNHDSSSKKLESVSCSSKDDGKKKLEDNNSALLVPNNSNEELVRIQSEQLADRGATGHENGSSEALKEDIGEGKMNSGAGFGDVATDGRSISPARELPSCSKLNADKQDSASTRVMSAVSESYTQRVGKFEIDLMAPPPMVPSPEGHDLSRGDLTSETKSLALDMGMKTADCVKVEDKVETLDKKDKTREEIEEEMVVSFKEKLDVLKRDLEKTNNDNDIRTKNKLVEPDRNNELPTPSSISKIERTVQSISTPLSTAESGHSNCVSSIRCMPPLQEVLKTDKTTGSLTRRPKRCATHYYIACNILHQQFTKMSSPLPAAICSVSTCGTKPSNVNSVPSVEGMTVRKQSQRYLPVVNQNAAQEKVRAATSSPSVTAGKSSNNANPMDSTHSLHLVFQQGPNPGSTGNLVHGPAFLYPPGQHQASVAAASNQAGGVNSHNSVSSYTVGVGGSPGTSSTFPVVSPAISFSYPNFSANGSPYMTIVHNNGYSFPFSTSLGTTAAIRGASPAQSAHILSGPFYSSQTIHPLQHTQQHPQSQALVQPSYLNASTSSSLSSYKQSQGVQVNGNSTSTSTNAEQSQKRQTSQSHLRKHEIEMSGGNAPSVTANRTCYPQKNVHGQNFTIPVQPVNFTFKPSTSDIVGANVGNFGDKQQQPQQPLKGGVEIIPSQAFAISFAAFNGTSVPSNLNFSSMTQNPVILQSLPDIGWQGYQAANTPHAIQQKNYTITEAKSGVNSLQHQDDEKKTTHGKSSTNGPTTLVFDNSSNNLNFVPSANGNWSSHTIASTAITSVPLSSNSSSSQQPPQLLQLQKQPGMPQQQPAMATRYKASSTNATPAAKFANNASIFSQTLPQSKGSSQTSHNKSSSRSSDSHVHHSSVLNTPTLKSFSQEQGRVLQGQMQISFGGNYVTSLPPHGQQLLNNNQPLGTVASGTPFSGENSRPNSEGSKVSSSVNTSQLQQTENSSAGSGQKSSPVCGRNVPSILSSCPSQLSELKY